MSGAALGMDEGARTTVLKNQRVIMLALEELLTDSGAGSTFTLRSLHDRVRTTEEYLADRQRVRREKEAEEADRAARDRRTQPNGRPSRVCSTCGGDCGQCGGID